MKKNIAVLVSFVLVFMGDTRGHAQTGASRPSTRNEIGLQIGATERRASDLLTEEPSI